VVALLLLQSCLFRRHFPPGLTAFDTCDGFGKELFPVGADPLNINFAFTCDWPEPPGTGLFLIPVVFVRRTDEDTLTQVIFRVPTKTFTIAIECVGDGLLHTTHFRSRERIHLRDFDQEFALEDLFKRFRIRCTFVLFGEPLTTNDVQRRRLANTLWSLKNDHVVDFATWPINPRD